MTIFLGILIIMAFWANFGWFWGIMALIALLLDIVFNG